MKFWRSFFPFLSPLVDAEVAHKIAFQFLKAAPPHLISYLAGGASIEKKTRIWNLDFRSPLGLAAGFDKNAEIVYESSLLGFGFTEIGTVTPRPQIGNPKPRLFRDFASRSLFNQMGFNNDGAIEIAKRLSQVRSQGKLPEDFRVGVNIGKNKDTSSDDAASDYFKALSPFQDLADYIVVNISSPNTPGLRSLQSVEQLSPILHSVVDKISQWKKRPPLLVKLAPELEQNELEALIGRFDQKEVQGWILTNTLQGEKDGRVGGWSGKKLTDISREKLLIARKLTSSPIISVGGIMSEENARERLALGAQLIQIYSGWIFEGPSFPKKILQNL